MERLELPNDLKIFTAAGLGKLNVSETVRSALRAVKTDLVPPASSPFKHSAVLFDEDVSTPATKKPRLIAPQTVPSMLTKKALLSRKKQPGKIFSFFESWSTTKDCKDGTAVTFNQLSEDVQHSPAKKVKYECNICNKRTFDSTRGLSVHRKKVFVVKHQQLACVGVPVCWCGWVDSRYVQERGRGVVVISLISGAYFASAHEQEMHSQTQLRTQLTFNLTKTQNTARSK